MNHKSIAVLPFLNLSSDPENEYFSDGVTEEIMLALSGIKELKVTSRTSAFAFKNKQVDIRTIGNQLGVSTILEGSIRRSGNRVRIATQLIRSEDGFLLWSQKFDRELGDIFPLQDEISLRIAEQIRENFGHMEIGEHLVEVTTSDLGAYDCYLKARFNQLRWEQEGFIKAVYYYQMAVEKDANYAQAYFGLFQCYGMMAAWDLFPREEGFRLALEALKDGASINNNLPEYHFSLNYQALWADWDYAGSFAHLKKALQLSPNNAEYLESVAELYMSQGKFDDAKKLIKLALEVNPLSANHHFTKGNIFYLEAEFEQALEEFNRSLEIDPSWMLSLQSKAFCLILLNRKEELEAFATGNSNLERAEDFLKLYDLMHTRKGVSITDSMQAVNGYFAWNVYLPLYYGNVDEAVNALKEGIEHRLGQFINFKDDPLLEPIRNHPVFVELKNHHSVILPDAVELLGEMESDSSAKMTDSSAHEWIEKLTGLMNSQKLFLNPNIDLKELADSLGLHSNTLSWLLNDKLEMNFNDFINSYRLQEFQERAVLPDAQQFTLLGLAFESGFSSKSTFNEYFKKKTGLSPSKWVKEHS